MFQVQDNLSFYVSSKLEDQKQIANDDGADQKQEEGLKGEDESSEKSLEKEMKPEQEKDLGPKLEVSDDKPEVSTDKSAQEKESPEGEKVGGDVGDEHEKEVFIYLFRS